MMKPVSDVDVLVVGGGPAGLGAAMGAARAVARTMLLERYGFFGGVAAYGMGMPINQVRPGGRPRGAVHELFLGCLQAYGDEAVHVVDHALVCNVEFMKVAAMDALDGVGCRYLLHSRVVDARVEAGRVTGVALATKEGTVWVRAGAIVDSSGDADVAYFAGAQTLKGREGDGLLSPMTLCLLIVNVDVPAARAFQREGGLRRLVEQARAKYPLLPERMHFELGPFTIDNALVVNHAGTKLDGVLDGTDPYDMTEAERYSRRQALQIVCALREYGGPAFRSVQLGGTGPQVGVRETRRLKGLYVLTEDDALSGQRFDDVVAWRSGFLDIGFVRYETMKVHDVPYRALLPEKVDGLLVAGRCISASHVAASAGKSMGNCMATGHAAGLAAALSVRQSCQPRELDIRRLQAALVADGVDLAHAGV
jgi:ribulose 1,5-bisphosphate synthetase/thiazole synthase